MSRAKNHREIHENPQKWEIRVLVAPKVGISGGHPKVRGAENGFKTAERNFVKTVKISSQSEQALKSF